MPPHFGPLQTPSGQAGLSNPPSTPDDPPTRISPNKRPRSDTLELPRRKPPPPLKATKNYFFKGMHPMFIRTVDHQDYDMMWVECRVPRCADFRKRKVKRTIDGTATYKSHYQTHHPRVLVSVDQENRMKATSKKTMFHVPKPT